MQKEEIIVPGIVIKGYRVASLPSKEYPYPALEKQKTYFKERGLDLERFFPGTLNVSISPLRFEMVKPAYTFRHIAWTDLHPPEDFSFSPCRVKFKGREYDGYVYYPHPETKVRHFQDASMIEVITDRIQGIRYGARLELALDPAAIYIHAEDWR